MGVEGHVLGQEPLHAAHVSGSSFSPELGWDYLRCKMYRVPKDTTIKRQLSTSLQYLKKSNWQAVPHRPTTYYCK